MWEAFVSQWDRFKTWWPAPLGLAGLILGLVHVGPPLIEVSMTLAAAVLGAYVTIKVDIGKLQERVASMDTELGRLIVTFDSFKGLLSALGGGPRHE